MEMEEVSLQQVSKSLITIFIVDYQLQLEQDIPLQDGIQKEREEVLSIQQIQSVY